MRILVLYGVGTEHKEYRRRFFKKYPYLLENRVAVTFRSTYRNVDINETYDAIYADIDTINERDKSKLAKYMKYYANVPRRHISLTRKTKLKTYLVSPVSEFNNVPQDGDE